MRALKGFPECTTIDRHPERERRRHDGMKQGEKHTGAELD
jgi:hypothetical protein